MAFGGNHYPSIQIARVVASELAARRNKLGLTRAIPAQRMNIPVGVLEAWEKGRTFPEMPALFFWMKSLNFTFADMRRAREAA